LIADSCFSGSVFIDKSKEKFSGDRRDTEPSRWGLTSGKKEIVSDGEPGKHSPFATALLDVLRKADQPPGVMRICDLVLEKVVANAHQTPMGSPLAVKGHQGGQFVFHFRADENADWKEMKDSVEGCRRYLAMYPEGKYRGVAEAVLAKAKEEEAWQIAKAANSVRALVDFERRFPESRRITSGEVNTEIAQVEEEELWQKATRFNTVTAYRDYIWRSQLHKYRKEADGAIAILLPKEDEPDYQNRLEAERRVAKQREEEAALKNREAAEAQRRKDTGVEMQVRQKREQENLLSYSRAYGNNSGKKKETPQRIYALGGGIVFLLVLLLVWRPWATITDPFESQMVQVIEGSFMMGFKNGPELKDTNSFTDPAFNDNENSFIGPAVTDLDKYKEASKTPERVHTVTLSNFYIGKYEVTQAQWRKVMGADPPALYNKGCDQCPVEGVSWDDVQTFLKKLNENSNKPYRLPTEAEWEYAARGGNKSNGYKYAGSNDIDSVAWYYENSQNGNTYGAQKTTRPVGGKMSNELGLYDMSGNVWEWCNDWYGPYSTGAQANPKGPGSGEYRVLRGGSWHGYPGYCRPADRHRNVVSYRDRFLGFRLAQD